MKLKIRQRKFKLVIFKVGQEKVIKGDRND